MDKKELKILIRNMDAAEQIDILKQIAERKDSDEFLAIVDFIASTNKGVQETVIKTLSENGSPQIIKELIVYLENQDPQTRNAAVDVLYKIADKDIDAIGSLITYPDYNVNIFGCQILGFSKDDKALYYLKKALENKETNIRNTALTSLENIDKDFSLDFLFELMENEEEDWIKFSILNIIEKKGTKNNIIHLIRIIERENDFIASEALDVFKKIADISSVQEIVKIAIRSQGKEMEAKLNETILGLISAYPDDIGLISKDSVVLDYIEGLAKRADINWDTYKSINILAATGNKRFIELYKSKIKDPSPLVKIASINALSTFESENLSGILEECLIDDDEEVRKTAEKTLKKILKHYAD